MRLTFTLIDLFAQAAPALGGPASVQSYLPWVVPESLSTVLYIFAGGIAVWWKRKSEISATLDEAGGVDDLAAKKEGRALIITRENQVQARLDQREIELRQEMKERITEALKERDELRAQVSTLSGDVMRHIETASRADERADHAEREAVRLRGSRERYRKALLKARNLVELDGGLADELSEDLDLADEASSLVGRKQ